MKTFVCERCGKSYSTFYEDEKIHYCDKCTKNIVEWLNEKLDFDISVIIKGRY